MSSPSRRVPSAPWQSQRITLGTWSGEEKGFLGTPSGGTTSNHSRRSPSPSWEKPMYS